jgi:nucleotide-binding universal stress UspA family protein
MKSRIACRAATPPIAPISAALPLSAGNVPTFLSASSRILAATDFSEHSLRAVRHALWLARFFHAQLTLLHVVRRWFYAGDANVAPALRGQADEDRCRDATIHLESLSVPSEINLSRRVRTGHPWEEIVDYATEDGSDLIVLATHGHTGLAHALVGSVAERVLRSAPCPVLTVRSHADATGVEQ